MTAVREVEATFLIVDLVGFTAFTEAHGGREAATLVTRFVELARAALARGARLIERAGDALLIVAGEPEAALRTALALAAALALEPRFPLARLGLHTGTVVERDGAYFGPALNLTARVADHARAGQILCTRPVAERAAPAAGVTCRSLGPVRFKNVIDPVEVLEIVRGAPGEGDLAIDPVCRMRVEPAAAPGRLTWQGREWYFCSFECARAFAERPADYAVTGPSR